MISPYFYFFFSFLFFCHKIDTVECTHVLLTWEYTKEGKHIIYILELNRGLNRII